MIAHQDHSFARLLLRAVLPSPLSGILCASFGIVVVTVYLVMQSVSLGTSLPHWLDGEWSIAYTNHIVQPLLAFFTDFKVENALFVLGWGFLGLVVYLLVEFVVRGWHEWRTAETNIQLTDRAVLKHAGQRSFYLEALWRLGVLAVFSLIFVLGVSPVLHSLATLAPKAVLGKLSGAELPGLCLLAVKAALLSHAGVVFLRLFLSRVRLFSDDPY
ncbi:MAG TPA: hypothetical protein VLI54_04045 [Bacillota bacterium]|nr:hypothetical protein [Bacillota bacterium]